MELVENLDMQNDNNNFFESTLGKVINNSIETGLKIILPDFLEDEVIDIKNTLIEEGFSEAIKKTIDSAINIGKSAIGTITGNFESVEQAEMAIKKGGLIEGLSDVVDFILDKVKKTGLIQKDTINLIKKGKDTILKNVSSNIKSEFEIQSDKIEKLSNYNEKWRQAYESQDFKTMEKNMKKISEILKNVIPVESIINESRTIENLHNLIKNNEQKFDLNDEQKQLAKLLL